MIEARPLQIRSDRSDRSDPFGILELFRSDLPPRESDRSDQPAPCAPAGPTGPTDASQGRTEITVQNQCGPTGPTGPTDFQGGAAYAPSPFPEAEALDTFEERAAIREHDGEQPREAAEAAALAEVAGAAGMTPEALRRLWAQHPDARTYLSFLVRHGPATAGAASRVLRWPATRAWQAEARLRAAGLALPAPHGAAMARDPAGGGANP